MAIESISGKTISTVLPTKPNGKEVVDVKQHSTAAIAKDSVDLTVTAQDIKSSVATGVDVPAVDEERVAEIKSVVQAGEYRVDVERVAEKMMQFEVKLPGST